jgi:hypothetical protein
VSVPGLDLSTSNVDGTLAWQVTFTVPDTVALGTYPVVVTPANCNFPEVSVTVIAAESISLVKTVGTTPGVCATTSNISVSAGATVYYCYTVTNNTLSTLATHSLSDDKLGALMANVAQSLAPGASTNTVALGKTVTATINDTTTNNATWTAHTEPGVPFTATASATVTVTPATTVPAAIPVAATPSFTG